MGFEPFGRCVTYGLSLFENLRFGTTKDQIFVCDFTFEKCHSRGIAIFLLGEGVEVVTFQQERDLTRVGQLAVSCARHWFGIEIENAEVLFSSSSMACRCSFNLFNLSVTSVVWTVDPFPVNGSRLIW